MGTPTLIGLAAPRGAYTARYLHWGEHPDTLVPVLRRTWTRTFDRDSHALAAALLARDWSHLDADPTPRRGHREQPVPGVGYPAPTSSAGPRHGSIRETLDTFVEWLYLLHPEERLVVVYEATCHDRWLRHSVHHLNPVDELFVTEPDPADTAAAAMTVCGVCGAVDEVEHHELPSMTGAGLDTSTACQRCGSTVTTDPMFGARTVRRPWPPAADGDRTAR